MSLVVLLILASVWAVFLVPQVLRVRAEKGPSDSIGAFRNQLSVLERATPGAAPVVRSSAAYSLPSYGRVGQRELVRRRRQNVLVSLLGIALVTLVLGVVARPFLLVNVVADVLVVAYCALLVRARNVAVERSMKVRYLPTGPVLAGDAPGLLQRANG